MLKIDLHTHTADDPSDFIPHTTHELIDRAAALGFNALAVTLHDQQLDVRAVASYALARGIVMIPGVERTIDRRHVLLLNFPPEAEFIESFDHLRQLKAKHPSGLVVAPHPFFPLTNCLRNLMDRHADLFDAVEINGFHTASFDFNRKAVTWARAHKKPLVGSSDAHRLQLLGKTFSFVEAEPTTDAICSAIKRGHVRVETLPLSLMEAATYFAGITVSGLPSLLKSTLRSPMNLGPPRLPKGVRSSGAK